jgi:hypothetical protein
VGQASLERLVHALSRGDPGVEVVLGGVTQVLQGGVDDDVAGCVLAEVRSVLAGRCG